MKTRDLNYTKCILDDDQRILVKEEKIWKKWKSYFEKLFNESDTKDWKKLSNPIENRNHRFV